MKLFTQWIAALMLVAGLNVTTWANTDDATHSVRVEVNGLVCAFCAQGIRSTFNRQDASAEVLVSLEHRLVAVEFKPGMRISDEDINRLLTDAGYNVVSIAHSNETVAAIRASLNDEG